MRLSNPSPSYFVIKGPRVDQARNGNFYVSADILSGPEGCPQKMRAFDIDPTSFHGDTMLVCAAGGYEIDSYNNALYVKPRGLVPCKKESLPESARGILGKKAPFHFKPRDCGTLILQRIQSMQSTYLQDLVVACLCAAEEVSFDELLGKKSMTFSIDRLKVHLQDETSLLLRAWGAVFYHHAYSGGWILHTSEVLETAMSLLLNHVTLAMFGKQGTEAIKDLIVAGAILHDIGKLYENGFDALDMMTKTYYGELHGGDLQLTVRVVERVACAACLDQLREENEVARAMHEQLIHILDAHHGTFGNTVPRTFPAAIVQMADASSAALAKMRDGMITLMPNEKSFFYEKTPFYDVRKMIPGCAP